MILAHHLGQQSVVGLPALDDVVFVIDSIQPVTAARGAAMAKLGLTVLAQARASAAGQQPPTAVAPQISVVEQRLRLHAAAVADMDPNEIYAQADALRTDLAQALALLAKVAAPAARDRVFADSLTILEGVASQAVQAVQQSTAGTVFAVLSVVGTVIGGIATAYAVWKYYYRDERRRDRGIPGVIGRR